MTAPSKTLYRKVGRKYVPVSTDWDYEKDRMKVGEFRLTYCYSSGGTRYEYKVEPATASWVAAAMVARQAMEDAIKTQVIAKPHIPTQYTRKQQAIIKRFRAEMAQAGGLLPHWWDHTSAYDISQAAVRAVEEYRP